MGFTNLDTTMSSGLHRQEILSVQSIPSGDVFLNSSTCALSWSGSTLNVVCMIELSSVSAFVYLPIFLRTSSKFSKFVFVLSVPSYVLHPYGITKRAKVLYQPISYPIQFCSENCFECLCRSLYMVNLFCCHIIV